MGQIIGLNTSTYNTTTVNKRTEVAKKEDVKNTDAKTTASSENTVATNSTGDTLEVSNEKVKPTKPKVDEKELAKLLAEANDEATKFNNFINKVLGKQGSAGIIAGADATSDESFEVLKAGVLELKQGLENGTLQVSQEDIDKARELTSEDGYYGVKQTSARIVDFAKAISGGDTYKAELLREAVQKGFDSAAELWGGMDKAPQITKDTYDAVMKGFDEWVNGTGTVTE